MSLSDIHLKLKSYKILSHNDKLHFSVRQLYKFSTVLF